MIPRLLVVGRRGEKRRESASTVDSSDDLACGMEQVTSDPSSCETGGGGGLNAGRSRRNLISTLTSA